MVFFRGVQRLAHRQGRNRHPAPGRDQPPIKPGRRGQPDAGIDKPVVGVAQYRARRSLGLDAAATIQDDHPVDMLNDVVEPMVDDQDRLARRRPCHPVTEPGGRRRRQLRGRLVGQHEIDFLHHHRRQRDKLALAARQRRARAFAPSVGNPESVQSTADPFVDLGLGHVLVFKGEGQLVLDGHAA